MKKLIALMLLLAAVFALCACGEAASEAATAAEPVATPGPAPAPPSEAELKQQAEQEAFDAAVALLEEEKYDEAIAVLLEIESYKRVAEKITEIEDLKAETERLAAEAEEAAHPKVTIEITKDNWKEYFDIKKIPVFDTFGQLSVIDHCLVPKKEIVDRLAYQYDFQVDFAFKADGEEASVVLKSDGTLKYGKPLPGYGGWCSYDEVLTLTNEDLSSISNYVYYNGDRPESLMLVSPSIYHEGKKNETNKFKISINKVQGSIILYE